MQRRTFLQTTLATGGIAAMSAMSPAEESPSRTSVDSFELRSYTVKPEKQEVLDAYLRDALIPALNRLGIKQVGAFHEIPVPPPAGQAAPPFVPATHLLITYPNLELNTLGRISQSLENDADYQKAAAGYFAIPATEAVYDRIESSLLSAFSTMPRLEAPEKRGRLFNLRVYESHSEAAGLKKIEMFNKGEIDIFRRVGLTPVLFGQAIVGPRMPNLTYLLAFDDEAGRLAAWNKFRSDAEWQKLKAIPEYEDKRIVSRITNKLMTPADYSQI